MSAASIDTAAISQADSITLAIADANAGAVIDAPVITQTHALVAADAQAAAILDDIAIDLGTVHDLLIDGLVSPAKSGGVAITQVHDLVAADARAAAFLDGITFGGLGLGEIHNPSLINVTPRMELRSI
ncbi:MAG TPA: hypothetical protein ENJ17_01385 [Gammaproteobacteria bacterium]|nr:hypothetical protein [Gammaproteobacteria bacterium]